MTNYRLRDGDTVVLLAHTPVDGYWFEPSLMSKGEWVSHMILEGSKGVVVMARTPCVFSEGGRTEYFANVDVPHVGGVSRVRVKHDLLRRVRK